MMTDHAARYIKVDNPCRVVHIDIISSIYIYAQSINVSNLGGTGGAERKGHRPASVGKAGSTA